MQTIYLDISNKGVVPTIYAKQGDVGRKFEVVLTDSGLPYIPPSGAAFSVWYCGASGEGNYTDIGDKSAFSVNGNKVAVEMISQMLLNDGDGVLSLALNDPNGNQISTWNTPYVCEFVPGIDSEEAENYYTAFSNAVQNLPYPDDSLSVAGKAADAASTGAALNGKAPAGYGLGAGCTTIDSVKSITKNGWYVTQGDGPVAGVWFCHAKCSEDAYNIVVDAWSADGKKHAKLTKNGTWEEEWEWYNAPLNEGVEYRTAERWYSYPVYTKLINAGVLPNNSTKSVTVYENGSGGRVLSVTGFENASGQVVPSACFGLDTNKSVGVGGGSNSVYLSTNFDGSAFTEVMLTVKYFKT